VGLLFVTLSTAGCGSIGYSVNVVRATRSVEQARQMKAVDDAPYEIALAEAYLQKAREESSEAAYQDAIRYARLSRENADKAIELARRRRQGAGR
jgi:hypothetical protein